ncbi:MAG: hypothetical protein ACI9OJ_005194, partial [Myxococcota bacterium]
DSRGGGRGDRGGPRTIVVGAERTVTETVWKDVDGAPALHDYVRVSAGLMNGKVGRIVEITSKGNFKVALGDGGLVFEVPNAATKKVTD